MTTPPIKSVGIDLPIVLHIKQAYKVLYQTGTKLPKQHRLGIHHEAEMLTLKTLEIGIEAVLRPRSEKNPILYDLRRKIETLKHLVRIEQELSVISEKQYIRLASILTDISMMATGWQKSIAQTPPKNV